MGWWADRAGTKTSRKASGISSSVMTAAGARINLQDRNVINTIAATKMNWQHQAWNYRDLIGEMGSALRFRQNQIAKVALVIGQVNDLEDEPIPLNAPNCTVDPIVAKAAQDALNRLPWRNGHAFGGKIDTQFGVAGEAWLHGKTDPITGQERWTVRSTDEIQPVSGASNLGIVEVPGRPAIPIDKEREALLRLWNPHPRFAMLADSPLRGMLDVCEDIVLIGREIRAAARSRISANGVWMIPDSMHLARRSPGGSNDDAEVDEFAAGLEAAMLAPIANEGDAGAVVPIIIRGDAEDIAAAAKGFIRFDRETSPELIAKLDNGLKRMAETLDIPPTVMTGLQDTNHWNAYVIDDQTWENHLEPGERLIVDSLTEGYLRPILQLPVQQGGYGLAQDQAQTVQVWFDATAVTRNPNRSQDAQTAFGLGAIGFRTLRESMGFEESDAPSDAELAKIIALKVSPDPATAGVLISKALGMPTVVQADPTQPGAPALPAGPATPTAAPPRGAQPPSTRLPAGQASVPAQTRTGMPQAPQGAPVATRGAGHPQRVLDSEDRIRLVSGQRLVDLDRALRQRLLDAADQAVTTAVEKAAKRVVSAAQHKVDAATLAQHRGADLVIHLGADGVAALGLTEDTLLSAAFAYLYEKFMQWSLSTIADAVKVAVKVFGMELHAAASLRNTLAGRRQKAWHRFEHSLRQRAMDKLYGKGGTEDHVGEAVDSIVMPGDVRTALAEVGGAAVQDGGQSDRPLGGIATGPDMLGAIDKRMQALGVLWQYGITPRGRHFEPHRLLDGQRFADWKDQGLRTSDADAWVGEYFRPGDHKGCMCDYIPVWAIDDHAEKLRQQIAAPESPDMQGNRLLADLDNAAGRSGTTAQRTVAERERILAAQKRWLSNAEKAGSGS